MNTRNWPIRSKIIALVVVPLAALITLWIFATTLTAGPALKLLSTTDFRDNLTLPGETLISELQQERRLSLVYLAGEGESGELREQRDRTDQAIQEFRHSTSHLDLDGEDLLRVRLEQTYQALDILPAGRGFIDRGQVDTSGALGLYSSTIAAVFGALKAVPTLPDEAINRQVRALTTLGQAREVLSQADATLAGAFSAGRFADGEHVQFVQLIGAKRVLIESALRDLPEAERARHQRMTEGEAFVRLNELEDTIARGGARTATTVDAAAWHDSHQTVQQQMRDFERRAGDELAEQSRPVAVGILVRLGLAGIVGLAAVVVSLVIAVRIGRALVQRLTRLRDIALDVAQARLPNLVERLRRGEEVDAAAEVPSLDFGQDEICQVGVAFSEVHRVAVRSAIEEAGLRRGLNEVFLNIARRSQALLHRQLALLDRMERRATDPEELADLFQIDHMATRMRRHAEDLVILAGANPGRGWRNPVPMIDVIRGAVSEVEDYARVEIVNVQPAATVGRAVADVIHLLAELIENATSFSPPHTNVRISGQAVPNGYAIEIEDRGLGMSAEAIEEANRRLAEPPEFDPANSARLGLFVVARLADRHGVRVRLRRSPYGGVTAVALLPADLVVMGVDVSIPARPGEPLRGTIVNPASAPVALPAGSDTETTQELDLSPVSLLPPDTPSVPRPRHPDVRLPVGTQDRVDGSAPTLPVVGQARSMPTGTEDRNQPDAPPEKTDNDGLPRRVRQNRIAQRSAASTAAASTDSGAVPRSPDEVRAAMSALQMGTARGRREAASRTASGASVLGVPATRVEAVVASPAVAVSPSQVEATVVASGTDTMSSVPVDPDGQDGSTDPSPAESSSGSLAADGDTRTGGEGPTDSGRNT